MEIGLPPKGFWAEVNLLETWLNRAGQYPLSIEIFRNNNFQPTWYIMLRPSLPKALIESCSRWRYFRLSGSYRWLYSGALDGVRNRLSHLQNLVYDHEANDMDTSVNKLQVYDSRPINLFKNTPQLRYCQYSSEIYPVSFTLPWDQLTGISARRMSLQACLDILAWAQNLVTLSITTMNQFAHPQARLDHVRHPHLRSLSITWNHNARTFLNFFTLPALSELRYTSVSTKSLLNFLSRSMCPLQILVLGLPPEEDASSYEAQILQLHPPLSELQTTHWCASDELLSSLTCRGASDSELLIPRLHTIELKIWNGKRLCPRLADMIESRWKCGADSQLEQCQITPLKHVRISMYDNINTVDSKIYMRLRRLRAEGLDIFFTDKDGVPVGI